MRTTDNDKAMLETGVIRHEEKIYSAGNYWSEDFEAAVYFLCDELGAGVESYSQEDIQDYAIKLGFDTDNQHKAMSLICIQRVVS